MAMAALSFPRLSKSIYGTFTLSPLTRPLLPYSYSQICRHSSSFSFVVTPSLTGAASRQSDNEVQLLSTSSLLSTSPIDPRKWQKVGKSYGGLECASFSGLNNGGSALFTTSAVDNMHTERSAYHEGVTINVEVAIPLCQRPATYITCLEDLLQWRRKAEQLAGSVGSEFYDADGGPDSSDLLTELEWLLDDAVAACCRRGRESDVCVKHWEACSWRDVKACLPALTRRNPSPVSMSFGNENSFKEEGDASQEVGAFSTLLKERYTDPVSEVAADGACCCDSLRDSLADMAAGAQGMNEMTEEKFSSLKPSASVGGEFPDLEDAVKRLDNKITHAHVLLRTSIEELEKQWVERVLNRRPFQYVVGCAHWRDLVLSVQEGVLIPRPETEQIIDLAEAAIAANPSLAEGVWADLGTGSGALAVALARLLPPLGSVLAVDASDIAVAVARCNVEHYKVEDRVTVVHGSWFSPLENQRGKLAGVMSNPPYIPSANIAKLQAEVGKHEPHCALDGGEDGLNDLRQICQGSSHSLRAGGFLVLETNGGKQAEAVADLLCSLRTVGDVRSNLPVSCFQEIRTVQDFAGVMRFVVATRC